jgi:hypothetical protein
MNMQPTAPKRPAILERCGLLTPAGKVAGAEMHPDADLLALIERYETLLELQLRWLQARESDQNGTRYKQLSDEAVRNCNETWRLEIKISETPANSILGAVAKVSAAMRLIEVGIGSRSGLPLAALADAREMLRLER